MLARVSPRLIMQLRGVMISWQRLAVSSCENMFFNLLLSVLKMVVTSLTTKIYLNTSSHYIRRISTLTIFFAAVGGIL